MKLAKRQPGWRAMQLATLGLLLLAMGCGQEKIETAYGRRRGADGAGSSVNGTAVLASMFRAAGLHVSSWRRLSPKLNSADAIVWFPDDFEPPSDEQRQFFERWLRQGTSRTLVYVGRDYDSAIDYWKRVRPTAPPEQAMEVARRLAVAQSDHDAARARMPEEADCRWFVMRRDAAPLSAQTLSGPWSDGIDAASGEVEIMGRLEPSGEIDTTPLLTAGGEPIVFELSDPSWGDGKLLVVTNGSFLLNFPLVNHQHRKLAGKLVAACEPAQRAVFLESREGGPSVVEREADSNYPTGMELFTVWPLGFVMLHLAIVGITLCIACFPIFGRPRELAASSTSDFGQHVTAVGELLARTQDRAYAIESLRYYKEHVRSERGGE